MHTVQNVSLKFAYFQFFNDLRSLSDLIVIAEKTEKKQRSEKLKFDESATASLY